MRFFDRPATKFAVLVFFSLLVMDINDAMPTGSAIAFVDIEWYAEKLVRLTLFVIAFAALIKAANQLK